MVLSGFLRKRKRELQTQSPKAVKPRALPKRSIGMSSWEAPLVARKPQKTTKVVVDQYVMKAMQIETETLLRNRNPASACALAVALAQSDGSVMAMYEDGKSDDDENGGISSLIKKWKRFSLKPEKEEIRPSPDLKSALAAVESGVDSGSTQVSSWAEAKAVLSSVIEFPDETAATDQKITDSSHDLEEYRKRIKEATQVNDIDDRFQTSREQWKQVAQSRAEEPALVDDQFGHDVAAISDQMLSESIAQAYEEREARMKNKAVKEIEDRLEVIEREEEANQIASSLLRPLLDEEQEVVYAAMYGEGPPGEVLAQVGTDSVQRQSLHRLQPGQWLNDEVIHYFYVMLSNRDEEMCRLDPSRKRCFFFKSFFMTKLLNEGNADPSKDGQYEYKNVKRWSKRVPGKDIFKLDKIFFPINQGRMHWMCAVIHMTERRIQMYDSMGSGGMHYLRSLFQYLQDEHMDKKGVPLPDIDKWQLVGHQPGTPCQRNGYDCGVFTCMFADFLSKDCPLVFSQEHITQCRERIALSIMNGSAIM